MDKKTDAFTVHLPACLKKQVSALADVHNLPLSRYVYEIVKAHVEEEAIKHRILAEVFKDQGNCGNCENCENGGDCRNEKVFD